MSADAREQRLVFGEVAELYDAYRPSYPEQAFDRIMEFGPLQAADRVLEVGSGTGRATVPLAARGLEITGLEPSPQMARVARRQLADFPRVHLEEALFESWRVPAEPFRLVTSAQAWHWVPPEVRLVKAHQVLEPGGCLALLWNTPVGGDAEDLDLEHAIEDVYRREAPEWDLRVPGDVGVDRLAEIAASGLFTDLSHESYPWATTYSADSYLGLLQTQSDHRLLDPPVLERLLEGLAAVLASHGNQLRQGYRASLYLARRPR